MFLPSSQKENDEVSSILRRNGVSGAAWIRISDVYKEGVWIDIENNAPVNFTNWASDQPNTRYNYDFAYISSNREWYAHERDAQFRNIICELP